MDSLESNVFINEDDFLKKINCFNLNLIEVDSYNDLDIILSMSVDSFLTFAHKKQLDIFYQFNYLDETDYLITGSTVIDSIPSVLFSSHQIHSDFPAYLNLFYLQIIPFLYLMIFKNHLIHLSIL